MDERLHNWVNWILYDELMAGKINAPKQLLGIHEYGDGQVVTCYRPHSSKVSIRTASGKTYYPLEKVSEDGFYGIYFPTKKIQGTKYRLLTEYYDGTSVETADAYAFDGKITDFDAYLFAEG